jgi:hypothetical protein
VTAVSPDPSGITDEMVEAGMRAMVDLGCDGCDPDCSCRELDEQDEVDFRRAVRAALEGALAGRAVVDLDVDMWRAEVALPPDAPVEDLVRRKVPLAHNLRRRPSEVRLPAQEAAPTAVLAGRTVCDQSAVASLRAKLNGVMGALIGEGNPLADEVRAAKLLLDDIAGVAGGDTR